jgi:ribosomal protein S12 methylthiotransferase accessory factor
MSALALPVGADPFARLSDALMTLVDARTGIVRHVAEEPRRPDFPDIVQFAAQTCDTEAFLPHAAFGKTGGCAVSRPAALAKAVGEAVERYSAAVHDEDAAPLATARAAPFPVVPPGDWALNDPAQYALPDFDWEPFTPDTPVRWAMARDLVSGAVLGVPAAMVHVPFYFYPASGEPAICQPISTGLACHCSPEEALIGGLCEVIERDAFMIAWQAGLSRAQIDRRTLSRRNADLLARLESTGARVTLLDATLDTGVPVVMAVQTHEAPDMPAITVAASAALSAEEAVRKAMEEATHTARWMFYLKGRLGPLDPGPDFDAVDGQERHLQFWAEHANRPLAGFLTASAERVAMADLPSPGTGDPQADLAMLTGRIAATGHRPLGVDITPPDVADAGLSVVRALIPGFQPLIMGHRIRALGGERLWSVPQALGLGGRDRAAGDIGLPHPFP